MFVCNIKLNVKKLIIIVFIVFVAILVLTFAFLLPKSKFKVKDKKTNVNSPLITTTENYTDTLKLVYENMDSYIGRHIKISGYVYRNLDFYKDQFVVARNMVVSPNNQEFIVGFLCTYKDANEFSDGTWVEIEGTISKTNYKDEIPCINVKNMKAIKQPDNDSVLPPNGSYVPTNARM